VSPNREHRYHLDIKKLGRFHQVGHRTTGERTRQSSPRAGARARMGVRQVSIDDASRVAFTQIRPDETKDSAVAFLAAAVAFYRRLSITVRQIMTDNGS